MAIETSDLVQASGILIFSNPPIFFSAMGFDGPPVRVGVGIVRVALKNRIPGNQAALTGIAGGGPGNPRVLNIFPHFVGDPDSPEVDGAQIELYKLDGTPTDDGCSVTFLRLPVAYAP